MKQQYNIVGPTNSTLCTHSNFIWHIINWCSHRICDFEWLWFGYSFTNNWHFICDNPASTTELTRTQSVCLRRVQTDCVKRSGIEKISYNMGQSRPLFCLFLSFSHHKSITNWKSGDGVLGIQTRGHRMVGSDETTKR